MGWRHAEHIEAVYKLYRVRMYGGLYDTGPSMNGWHLPRLPIATCILWQEEEDAKMLLPVVYLPSRSVPSLYLATTLPTGLLSARGNPQLPSDNTTPQNFASGATIWSTMCDLQNLMLNLRAIVHNLCFHCTICVFTAQFVFHKTSAACKNARSKYKVKQTSWCKGENIIEQPFEEGNDWTDKKIVSARK